MTVIVTGPSLLHGRHCYTAVIVTICRRVCVHFVCPEILPAGSVKGLNDYLNGWLNQAVSQTDYLTDRLTMTG